MQGVRLGRGTFVPRTAPPPPLQLILLSSPFPNDILKKYSQEILQKIWKRNIKRNIEIMLWIQDSILLSSPFPNDILKKYLKRYCRKYLKTYWNYIMDSGQRPSTYHPLVTYSLWYSHIREEYLKKYSRKFSKKLWPQESTAPLPSHHPLLVFFSSLNSQEIF